MFVVDAAGGSGAHYTDLPAAVAAVPDGSTLVVRAGIYAPVTIDAKGLTLLGEPTFTIAAPATPAMTVRNTLPHQRVSLHRLVGVPFGRCLVAVEHAAGPVTIDDTDSPGDLSDYEPAFRVTAASQVTIRDCRIVGGLGAIGVEVSGSDVVFENCELRGFPATVMGFGSVVDSRPSLRVTQGRVQLVQTSAFGGDGTNAPFGGVFVAAAAVDLQAASLRVTGTVAQQVLGGTTPVAGPVAALSGTGAARVEPQIVLGAVAPGVSLVRPEMPSLLGDSSRPGGMLYASRRGPAGVLCVMTSSLRASATSLPWLPDPIGIDPQDFFVDAVVVAPQGGVVVVSSAVPNLPQLRGFEFVRQAFDLAPTGIVAASNPSPSFVR